MSEPTETVQASPVVKVTRSLTAIIELSAQLDDQALHKANDPLMPGGLSMVALADVANLEAWEHQYEAAEHFGREASHIIDEDDSWEPPLQTLLFWSEQWRITHDAEYGQRPTVASEASFIRWALDWAWDNEIHWDDFAADITRARLRLENVLYAGNRAERSRVVCALCDDPPRLVKVYQEHAKDDFHKCPKCKHRYDAGAFQDAYAKQLRSEGSDKFVVMADAIGTLKAQGRGERTIRRWFEEARVHAYCDMSTHVVYVWWPDLWALHRTTPTRARAS